VHRARRLLCPVRAGPVRERRFRCVARAAGEEYGEERRQAHGERRKMSHGPGYSRRIGLRGRGADMGAASETLKTLWNIGLAVSPWVPGERRHGLDSFDPDELTAAMAGDVAGARIERVVVEREARGATDRARLLLTWNDAGEACGFPATALARRGDGGRACDAPCAVLAFAPVCAPARGLTAHRDRGRAQARSLAVARWRRGYICV